MAMLMILVSKKRKSVNIGHNILYDLKEFFRTYLKKIYCFAYTVYIIISLKIYTKRSNNYYLCSHYKKGS